MDKQLQEARRDAKADPTQENMMRVFRLEAKQGLHPFKNSEEVYEQKLEREAKRAAEDQKMAELVDAVKTVLGTNIPLFDLLDAVAREGCDCRPRALLRLGQKCLIVKAMHLGNDISVDVELSVPGRGNQSATQMSLGTAYTHIKDFPGKLPEKIQAAITLYS